MKIEVFLSSSCYVNHISARFYNEDLSQFIALDFTGSSYTIDPRYFEDYSTPTQNFVILETTKSFTVVQAHLARHLANAHAFNLFTNNCADTVGRALSFCDIDVTACMPSCTFARIFCCPIPWTGANPTALFEALTQYAIDNNVSQENPPHLSMARPTQADHFPKIEVTIQNPLQVGLMR